jgi:adenylate kinase
MRLLIMGPPGAGKGTQATLIKKAYNIPHISTGDMFREAIENNTPLGAKAKAFMDEGLLVTDDITNGIVKERLLHEDCNIGFLLDGYPRTIVQAEFLRETLNGMKTELNAVLNLEISKDILVDRIVGRRVCTNCGASYHIKTKPSKVEGICDVCGSKLVQRDDDTETTFVRRLDVYIKNTEPLLEYYQEKGILININGTGDIDTIQNDIKNALGGLNDNIKK